MTMLRMLLPWIMGVLTLLGITWFVIYQIIKSGQLDEDGIKAAKMIGRVMTLLAILAFIIRIITMGSVNEVPRSVIDRSVPDNMKENFEGRVKRQAALPKTCDTAMKNCQPTK